MVLDEVLSRTTQIQRIPVQEGLPQLVQLVLRNLTACVFFTKEDVAPEIQREILRFDAQESGEGAVDAALKHVGDCVVCEIYGAVGK